MFERCTRLGVVEMRVARNAIGQDTHIGGVIYHTEFIDDRWTEDGPNRIVTCTEAPPAPSEDPLGTVAQRRVTDAAASEAPKEMLLTLAKAYKPGDTDLSWTRSTSWRSLLAATLDQPYPALLSGEVLAEPGNPSADLIAAWLAMRLGIEVQRGESGGPGITEVSFETTDGKVALSRPDGRNATLSWPGRPERRVALHRRDTAELVAEELRRLEPDEVYAETLRALAGSAGGTAQ